MTKDTIKLIEIIKENEELNGSDIKDLYEKSNKVEQPREMINLIDELDDVAYDFEFLKSTASDLGVTRNSVINLLLGLCELVGDRLEKSTRDSSFICEHTSTSPFKSKYVLYSASPNPDHAQIDLNRSEYSHLKLGECRKDLSEWYNLYVFELLDE